MECSFFISLEFIVLPRKRVVVLFSMDEKDIEKNKEKKKKKEARGEREGKKMKS